MNQEPVDGQTLDIYGAQVTVFKNGAVYVATRGDVTVVRARAVIMDKITTGVVQELIDLRAELEREAQNLEYEANYADDDALAVRTAFLNQAEGIRRCIDRIKQHIMERSDEVQKI